MAYQVIRYSLLVITLFALAVTLAKGAWIIYAMLTIMKGG